MCEKLSMRFVSLFLFLAFATDANVLAAPQKTKTAEKPKLPPLLQEVEAKYAEAGTVIARFTQVNETAALKQKKTSSGILMVKRPDKVRWETIKPDPNLLVSDGKTFWFYTPPFDEDERGQVIERKSSEVQSKLANALIAGSFSATKGMKIKKKGAAGFVITPRPGTAGTVRRAEISVDAETKTIKKVILSHKGGNRAEISLSSIELGKDIDEGLFAFKIPPNTDKVEE